MKRKQCAHCTDGCARCNNPPSEAVLAGMLQHLILREAKASIRIDNHNQDVSAEDKPASVNLHTCSKKCACHENKK